MARLFHTAKKVLSLRPDPEEFLEGLSANVPTAAHNAFVDVQGRVVAVFDQIRIAPDTFWLVLEPAAADRARDHLARHLDLSGNELKDEPYAVYHDLDGDYAPREGERRLPQKAGALIITPHSPRAEVKEEAYRFFRLRHGIPVQGADFDREMLLNVDENAYVSYTKGCFLGQEIIARVHHRGRPPRKLVVRKRSACTKEEAVRLTSVTRDPKSGEEMGFVFIKNEA